MQFPDQKNISLALVGKNLAVVADTTLVNGLDAIADGQIAILDINNKSINSGSLTATTVVRFVQRTGNELLYTPYFKVGDATCALQSYSAPAEQVSFIGYNGSAGSLDVINSNNYVVGVDLKDATRGNVYHKFGAYKSTASASQIAIATGLTDSLIRNFANEPVPYIRFSRTGNGTVAAPTGSATIAKVTKGSATVYVYTKTVAATVGLTASTSSVTATNVINIPSCGGRTFTFTAITSVGHAVYIGGQSIYVASAGNADANCAAIVAAINAATTAIGSVCVASGTTSVTITYNKDYYAMPPMVISDPAGTPATVAVTIASGDAVPTKYVAAATTSSAATFTLDIAYQGETGYAYMSTTPATHIGVSSSDTLLGIKCSGLVIPFQLNKYPYQKVNFSIILTNFTATTVTGNGVSSIGSAASPGAGVPEQIAELAEFCNYNSGKTLRGLYLTSDAITNDVVLGITKYEVAVIQAKKTISSGLGTPIESPMTLYLCFYKDSALGDAIAGILNTYYGSGAFS